MFIALTSTGAYRRERFSMASGVIQSSIFSPVLHRQTSFPRLAGKYTHE